MLKKLPPISNVTANGIATLACELPGAGLHALRFVLGGTAFTKAMISNIEIKVGERTLCDYSNTGMQLDDINTWRGQPDTADYLSFYFGSPEFVDFHDRHVGDLDLSVLRNKDGSQATLAIRINIVGATAPTLEVYGDILAPKSALNFPANEIALVKALHPSVFTPSGAVVRQNYSVGLGKGGSAVLNEFWFNAHLTSLLIEKNNITLLDDVASADLGDFYATQGRPIIAGMYVWSPTVEGFAGLAERTLMADGRTAYQWQHRVTTNAADTLTVLSEIITPFSLL